MGWEFYPSLVKAILREPLYVLIQTCNLHTRQFAFMPAANWFGIKRRGAREFPGRNTEVEERNFVGRFVARICSPVAAALGLKLTRTHAFIPRLPRHSIRVASLMRLRGAPPTHAWKINARFQQWREARGRGRGRLPIVASAGKLAPYGLAGETSLAEGYLVSCFARIHWSRHESTAW